ncbi:hypothetical protein [Hoyosella subflava]|uniref:DUF35 domain-containing protein n=1 Tax=Hoyosella subflava (strain DSM 45089 / JCM 17490 / NBRC 109087 / DQS3-9A1) TaxID=443218 RepID=F6ELD3_HOYSD|nr:hypothetical protein [Hoyosella subflava]AEF39225.1 hypothetical protein AS9A_0771 [Hoyosella subflava DQS3-9A1]
MTSTSAEPDLYSIDDVGVPTLFGARDTAGNISFPYQTYGSVFNGDHGAFLTRTPLCGVGTVTAATTVFHRSNDGTPTPVRVASIALEEGPLIRAVLADGSAARPGDTVTATTVEIRRDGNTVRELRFALADSKEDA